MRFARRALRAVLALLLVILAAGTVQHLRLTSRVTPGPPAEGAIRVASWNVHYILTRQPEGRWGLAGWEARKGPMSAVFGALGADIVAFQEMESFSGGNADRENLARNWLLREHPDYAAAAIGDWRVFPSTQPIFYRRDRFDLLDQGWFFFSETPDVIYSRTFNGSYPAFASWARFQDVQSGAEFRILNLHVDYASRENRRRSVHLVAEWVAPWIADGAAMIVAGDLNAVAGSALHRRLEGEGLAFAPMRAASYHLDLGLNLFGAIDHIAVTPDRMTVAASGVFQENPGRVRAADHYPVWADLRLTR